VPACPVPVDQVSPTDAIEVCTARRDGSTYAADDRITVCVTANIPLIAPLPSAPTIRVVNISSDGAEHPLLEGKFFTGQRCMAGMIAEPFGQETIRAQAINQDGAVFLEDTVTFTTMSR
jgi:hypothetical protein